jgi:hypothetical protein
LVVLTVGDNLAQHRVASAGDLFKEIVSRAEAAEVKLAEDLRRGESLAAADQGESYSQLGIDVTTKTIPLFKEAKKMLLNYWRSTGSCPFR